jgi:hypothetical protein
VAAIFHVTDGQYKDEEQLLSRDAVDENLPTARSGYELALRLNQDSPDAKLRLAALEGK